jgi:hypothetical protein
VLFEYLYIFYTAYIEDILIYNNNITKYKFYVKYVIKKLKEAGL